MKLRTEMVDGTVQDRTDNRDDQWRNLEHDAACAHALMQAIDEHDHLHEDDWGIEEKKNMLIRASGIMAEWDFDSGEATE